MELFIGPWNQMAAWSVEGMGGSFRFLQRLWTLTHEYLDATKGDKPAAGKGNVGNTEDKAILQAVHRAIAKVSEDLENLSFNTAIAALMETVNELYKIKADNGFAAGEWQFAIESLVKLLAPFAPHITEELWQALGCKGSVHVSEWPVHDPQYLVRDTVTVAVQVNGKLRGTIEVAADANQEAVQESARQAVQQHIEGKEIVKQIYVPGKIMNFVVK
jgi:leucyl-tRNA synthetase